MYQLESYLPGNPLYLELISDEMELVSSIADGKQRIEENYLNKYQWDQIDRLRYCLDYVRQKYIDK